MSHWTHAWWSDIRKHDALVASEELIRSAFESLPADLPCVCQRGDEICLRPPSEALANGTLLFVPSERDELRVQPLGRMLKAAGVRRLLVVSDACDQWAALLRQRLDPTECEIVEVCVGAGNADSFLSAEEEQLVAERLRALGYI